MGYTPTVMSSVPLKRIGGLAKAIVILTIIAAVTAVISAIASASVLDDARDYLDGTITEDEFLDAYTASSALGVVQGPVTIALLVLSIIWMYRIAANHRAIGRVGTWGPLWAVFGWVLPPLLYIIPFLMFREMWKASDPAVQVGSDQWKDRPVSPVVPVWFVVYSLVPIALGLASGENQFSLLFGDSRDLAEALDDQYTFTVIGAIATLAAAIVYVLLVRGLTARHRQLTGEATTPR